MISDTVRHSLIYSNDLFAILSLHFPKEYIKTFPLYSTWSRAACTKNASSFFTTFFDLTPPQPHCDYFIVMYFNKNWKTVYIISSVLKLNDSAES